MLHSEQAQQKPQPEPTFSEWLDTQERPSEVVEFEAGLQPLRKLHRLRIYVLAMAELDLARAMAFERIAGKAYKHEQLTQPIPAAVMRDAVAREVLALACTTINAVEMPKAGGGTQKIYPKIFKHAPHVSQLLSAADVRWLWDQYLRIERDSAPVLLGNETDDEEDTEDGAAD